MRARRRYTVSDGKLVLTLEAAEEGGYVVTSPLDPELITEAETVRSTMHVMLRRSFGIPNAPGI